NMLRTDTHEMSGQSGGILPAMKSGQCRWASLDTRQSVNNSLSTSGSVTAHAETPPGNTTGTNGPRPRSAIASPGISEPVTSSTTAAEAAAAAGTGCRSVIRITYRSREREDGQ